MPIATIIRDNREQKPYAFEGFPVDTEDATIRTGDYTLAEFCDRDAKNDTYLPRFAVERKSGNDFLNSIGRDRERFKDEIKRAANWATPMEVVIEESYSTFNHGLGIMEYRGLTPNQVTGTVRQWGEAYNVNFHFAGTRRAGERYTFETLMSWLRATIRDGMV